MFTLSRDEVRELDRRAIEDFDVPSIVLMENAGRGCAELLMRLNPERQPVVILCGPGNNGGDGFVIARHLDNAGWPVTAIYIADRVPTRGDAATNFRTAAASELLFLQFPLGDGVVRDPVGSRVLELALADGPTTWVVDALFGTGLARPLAEPYAGVLAEVAASKCPVLAIDIPSGLDCDTGEPLGPTIRATHTATFVAPKRGFLNPSSKAWTGEVHVIDIGAPRALADEYRRRTST
jgi:NAD(P)H-hydrate epimerase